ncbi:murein biosynthesis integral membrane protein MurJ [Miltoncostaea marina]|uniref:murein biosynthesis integral membrane protein MurJ n=1 Tax=Miltoncostaea marina TaxID=2843215 RepID=UPI001C3D29C4|nr:lipid II flippase MurJ [Miltoncostaea marina]
MTAGRLARAAAIVALFGLVSRLLGFARELVLAAAFGASAATDAFVNSLLIVNSVAAVLLYTLVTLIIPTFQRERAQEGNDSAWALVVALAFWTGAALVVTASLIALAPEPVAAIFNLDAEREARTAELIRIMAPALALQGFSAIFTAMLQIHGRFAGPAAVGVAFNFGIIVGVVAGQGAIGIEAAGWGVTVGAALQVLLQLPQFWRLLREARAAPRLTHPRLGAVGLLALPVMGASVLQQVNSFTDKVFASTLEAGRVSALAFASALGQAPRVALLLPLLTPLFPLIAKLVSEDREADALRAFRRVAGLLGLLSIPLMLVMSVYSEELAQLAFKRGRCGDECVDQISPPLTFYALALWPAFGSLLLNRTLSAANRQRDILWTTMATVGATIALDIALLGPMEQAGLALASTLGVYLNAVLLLWLMRRHFPALSLPELMSRQARVLAAGVITGATALVMDLLVPTRDLATLEMLPGLLGKLAVCAVVFVAAARLLARPELAEGLRSVRALTGRGGPR